MLLQDNLQGLQHIGISVTDLERSMAFYAQLGFTASLRKDIHGRSGEISVAMLEH